MPLITELPTTTLSHYFSADYLATRSRGPHLKTIIDDFLAYHGLFDKRRDEFVDSLEEFATLGFAWERAVVQALLSTGAVPDLTEASPLTVRRVYERAFSRALNDAELERRPRELIKPGEILSRGIYRTPDMANIRQREGEEWKATWTSARGGLEAHPDWLMQMPGYCVGLTDETGRVFNTFVLRAFYVNGMYEKGQMGKPLVRAWRLRWSDEELEENEGLIQVHKQVMLAEGRIEEIPTDGNSDDN